MNLKQLFRIFIDLTLIAAAFVIATMIRLEGDIQSTTAKFIWQVQLMQILPYIVLIKLAVLQAIGLYKKLWRYTDVDELIQLAKVMLIPALAMLAPRLFGLKPNAQDILALSYGVIVIDYLLTVSFLFAIRLLRSYLVEQKNIKKRLQKVSSNLQRTLIIGAGEAANELIKVVTSHPELGLKVVGALDDDKRKHNQEIASSVPVKGFIKDVQYWVDELSIDQIIFAIPSASRKLRQEISVLCNNTGLDIRTMPGVDQLAGGHVTVEQIRKLSMEDLLGRESIDLSIPEVLAYLENKRVLITGAGGSIGSELCRQLVSQCKIDSLCLLGKGENSIFTTLQELNHIQADQKSDIKFISKITDIRNESRLESIIQNFKPHVIFHAAAHKHVHLMEFNSCEAFENNVLGTQITARLAGKHNVETFVLVSTDKAVNPTSIMGSTKNLAEQVVLLTSQEFTNTRYTAVRFGNVLGSRGSVTTVWKQQLLDGKAITVTDKEVIRYFMTIPEASQLVIQAGAKAHNGEIMVLDMGTPIKIYELAKQFIQLSGFNVDEVPIDVIGLREGEKLYEELLTAEEFVDSKLGDKIYKAKLNFKINHNELLDKVKALTVLAKDNKQEELKKIIRELMKESHAKTNV